MLRRERAGCLLLAAVLIASTPVNIGGEEQTLFADGLPEHMILFPPGGGENSSVAVELPAGVEVLNASMDLEGRRALNGSTNYTTDFFIPQRNLAWAGNASVLPPVLPPASYEALNITAAPGIKKSDDVRYESYTINSAPYHLFEFYVGEANVSAFNITWEGIGFTQPQIGFGDNGATIYLWDRVARVWVAMDTQGTPEVPMEVVLTASATVNPSRYIDQEGYIYAFVAPKRIQYSNELETDYIRLTFGAYYASYPENLTLDVGADGRVEWERRGPLNATETFYGAAFVSALQKAVDAAHGGTARIPLKFTSTSGGLLFLSNLSIGYGPKDLPPVLVRSIPALELPEDGSVTGALDLREHFSDDGGAGNLSFELVWESGSGEVEAVIKGGVLSLFARAPDWNGELRAHVNATDAKGQVAVSNSFKVRVMPVNDPPVLEPVGELRARERVPFEYDFNATDVDGDRLTYSLNSSIMSIDPSTGLARFTPSARDIGVHMLKVAVEDGAGGRDTLNFTLVVENVNDPPVLSQPEDATVEEGQEFTMRLEARDPDVELGLDTLRFSDDSPLVTTTPDGLVRFLPDDEHVGVHRVNFTVTDSTGLSDTKGMTLTVLNVNDPPVLLNPGDLTAEEDRPFYMKLNATDEDAGDSLRFSSSTSLFIISQAGEIYFTPTQRDVGRHLVRVTVTDSAGARASVEFNLTVLNVNDPPERVRILSPLEGQSFIEGKEVTLEAEAEDEDGDELTYTWYSGGSELGRGRVVSTKALKAGDHSITVKVSDGKETVSSAPVAIKVKKPPGKKGGFMPGFGAAGLLAALLLHWSGNRFRRSRAGRGLLTRSPWGLCRARSSRIRGR
ncbi:MAG: tandem-95 repeat protein [Thermoplasmata archaeon]